MSNLREPAAAVLWGDFADFKLIKTRSVALLCIEIPIEQAEAAIKMFGIPQPGKQIPVAIARLSMAPTPSGGSEAHPPAPSDASPPEPSDTRNLDRSAAAKDRYEALSPSEKIRVLCVRRCEDPRFQAWASESEGAAEVSERQAAAFVRRYIGGSRSLIADDEDVRNRWIELETTYLQNTGLMAVPR